jgi:hypothetical protein
MKMDSQLREQFFFILQGVKPWHDEKRACISDCGSDESAGSEYPEAFCNFEI